MAGNDVHVAGIEFVTDRRGRAWTYDVNTNTNTNDNPDAERAAGVFGMRALAAYLGDELARAYGAADAALSRVRAGSHAVRRGSALER